MKFKDMPYERPDYEAAKALLETLMAKMEAAENAEAFYAVFDEINTERNHINTAATLCSAFFFRQLFCTAHWKARSSRLLFTANSLRS